MKIDEDVYYNCGIGIASDETIWPNTYGDVYKEGFYDGVTSLLVELRACNFDINDPRLHWAVNNTIENYYRGPAYDDKVPKM